MEHEHPHPTQRACDLVASSYDLHVYVAPDVMRRSVTDIQLAERYGDLGLAGFVLKSHYTTTAERASVVRAAVSGVGVYGAITLNGSVDGMCPVAVEIAARSGARLAWMPTVDSLNQRNNYASATLYVHPTSGAHRGDHDAGTSRR